MRFVDIIEKKKHQEALSKEEIDFFIDGYVKKEIPDYQVSALLMAIYFNGMNLDETTYLCGAMLHSGVQIDLSSLSGITCDKHSTGGVGDKTSLALGPMVAACGVKIAKMSGRGLGHTGGTLDKLESIDGFNIQLSQQAFLNQVEQIGMSIIGQSKDIVPADQMLYALRDVTGTVDSIPLIATSIMSKKLAAGSDAILLDVKYGDGAFMKTPEDAEILANTMVTIGKNFGKDVRAMITSMNQPLGNAIGNALEVKEAIATLQNQGPNDFTTLCLTAGSIMLQQAHMASSLEEGKALLQEVLSNGKAFEKFKQFIYAQHGNVAQIDDITLLPQAANMIAIYPQHEGYIKHMYAQQLGVLAMKLGAGRRVKEDKIDHSVGIVLNKKVGDYVAGDEPLAYIHTNSELTKEWMQDFYDAFVMNEEAVEVEPLIYEVIA